LPSCAHLTLPSQSTCPTKKGWEYWEISPNIASVAIKETNVKAFVRIKKTGGAETLMETVRIYIVFITYR
jgi:hypothetical protein